MAVSTVPGIVDALVDLAERALVPLQPAATEKRTPIQVLDGQPYRDIQKDLVIIGFTGNPGEAAVESALTREQMVSDPTREQYDITCLASAWPGGSVEAKPARDRAYELVDAVAAELMADPRLGRRALSVRLTTQALAQAQTDRGAAATVRFVIHVDAFAVR